MAYYINNDIVKRMRARRKEQKLTQAELSRRADVSLGSLKRFEQKVQKFMPLVSVLSASYTDKMLTISDSIDKKKKELLKKYKDGIDKQDPKVMSAIEK